MSWGPGAKSVRIFNFNLSQTSVINLYVQDFDKTSTILIDTGVETSVFGQESIPPHFKFKRNSLNSDSLLFCT